MDRGEHGGNLTGNVFKGSVWYVMNVPSVKQVHAANHSHPSDLKNDDFTAFSRDD